MGAALEKTNAAWLLELRDSGPNGVRAQRELRELVLRALRRGLERRPVAGALLEDFAQIGCDTCLDRVAAYAEVHLAGLPTPEALRLVERHLAICSECREEFSALAAALGEEL
jgi:hypothetical protein